MNAVYFFFQKASLKISLKSAKIIKLYIMDGKKPIKLHFERIFYYWRQKMYGHVHLLCEKFLREDGNDPLFLIWDGLADGAEGKINQGLSTIDRITNRMAMGLPIVVAKLCIHKMAKIPDFSSIGQLEMEVENLKTTASADAIVSAAQIIWLAGDVPGREDQAELLIHSLTTQPPPNRSAAALTGWIKILKGDRSGGRWFDMASPDHQNILSSTDAFIYYGKAMYYANIGRWNDALPNLSQLTNLADFPEAQLERARIYIAMNNWDLAIDAANESRGQCISEAEYYLIHAIYQLSQAGNLESARDSVKNLASILNEIEAMNSAYLSSLVHILTGLSWQDKQICQYCLNMYKTLGSVSDGDPTISATYGHLLYLCGNYKDAETALTNALTTQGDSPYALTSLIQCYIKEQDLENASMQLQFLETGGPTLALAVVRSQYNKSMTLQEDSDALALIEAMKHHLDSIQQIYIAQSSREAEEKKLGVDKYLDNFELMDMNTFSMAIIEVMDFCSTPEKQVAHPQNAAVCDLIALALNYIPGAVPFNYYLAVLAFGEGRYAQATKAIQNVLKSHWGFNASQCHLLLAQIRLQMKQFGEAEKVMNQAISYDFSIRESMMFKTVQAQLCEARGQYSEAIKILNEMIKSSEYQKSPDREKVKILLFLSRSLFKLHENEQSLKVINDALNQYKNTNSEGTIKLFQGKMLAKMNQIRSGLDILESFKPNQPEFAKAKKNAAKIYLTQLNDKVSYIRCFENLVEGSETKENYLLLGDALIKIKRFDDAVHCFQRSLELDESDINIRLKLARSLMIVHEYESAIAVYLEAASMESDDYSASLELCKAYTKLHMIGEAVQLAQDTLQKITDYAEEKSDWKSQKASAEINVLLYNIQDKSENPDEELKSQYLSEAINIYETLTEPNRNDVPADSITEIRRSAADLYMKSASEICENPKQVEEALRHAIDLEPGSTKALLVLAHLKNSNGNREECKELCQQILKTNEKCEEAALLLAEISSSESLEELEASFFANPNAYRTLVRLIELCGRLGDLAHATEIVDTVIDRILHPPSKANTTINPAINRTINQTTTLNSTMTQMYQAIEDQDEERKEIPPGLLFCQGLLEVLKGAPQKALEYFNKVKNDSEWREQALQFIFMIYSNPNRKYMWRETGPLTEPQNLKSAAKIIKKIQDLGADITLNNAQLLLSQNTDDSVKKALEIYNKCDEDNLQIIIGKCKCYLRLNKQRDATKLLNGIIHGEPTHANFSVFVEAFLMMTYISTKEQSFDDAEKYVEKAIELDKGSGKAWEMRGVLYEKRKDYMKAAESYKEAWDLSSESDLTVGFKLALNYMKASDPVEAIKISRKILAKHPNYPKLKDSIFLPCCNMLRT